MNESPNRVDPLKKIRLAMQIGGQPDDMDIVSDPVEFDFIFSIGTQGLTPLEYELAGKREGDGIEMTLQGTALGEIFQHIPVPVPTLPDGDRLFHFKFTIRDISSPENRDIVKAMSAAANCGDGCCGSH